MGASGNNISLTLTGTISSTTGTIALSPANTTITAPVGSYSGPNYTSRLDNGATSSYSPPAQISGNQGQVVTFNGSITANSGYTITSQSFNVTGSTTIVGGSDLTVTGQLTANVIQTRTAFPIGPNTSSVPLACSSSTNNTYYLEKASGNTLPYAEALDVVYTSATGTGHPNSGIYKATIGNGTTNAYISIGSNGVINLADPCV